MIKEKKCVCWAKCKICTQFMPWIKKNRKLILVAVCFLLLGFGLKALMSSPTKLKVALVDVPKLVNNAAEVQTVRGEYARQLQDLNRWSESKQAKIAKQKASEKEALVVQYKQELLQKKQVLDRSYAQEVNALDEKITKIIHTKAKSRGFDMVFAKNSVLDGGVDITDEIIELVK